MNDSTQTDSASFQRGEMLAHRLMIGFLLTTLNDTGKKTILRLLENVEELMPEEMKGSQFANGLEKELGLILGMLKKYQE